MSFQVTEKVIRTIRDYPHVLGHVLGYTKLTELHSDMIYYIWDTNEDRTIQGHRGSYKTTAVSNVGIVWWLLFHPNARIALERKKITDASNILRAIRGHFQKAELCMIFDYLYGFEPKFKVKREDKLTFNFKTTNTQEGNIDAYGVDTNITGYHYDKFIGDDMITLRDRTSKAEREKTKAVIMEVRANIMDPGKPASFIGTPWHKNDGWTVCPKPVKFDVYNTGILSNEEIQKKREVTLPSLFAVNYELKHISSENSLFTDAEYGRWTWNKKGAVGHLDAKFKGDHTSALTFFVEDGSKMKGIGFTSPDHVKEWYNFIVQKYFKYRIGTLYIEDNADKGFVASDLKKRGLIVKEYHESMNKHVKISNYLYKYWKDIIWDRDTEPEYLEQILDYQEGQEPDDCPDSAASLIREHFSGDGDDSALWKL